jgi:hypothetical protein
MIQRVYSSVKEVTGMFIVVREYLGNPDRNILTETRPFVYSTMKEAEEEAKHLAAMNPRVNFFVLGSVYRVKGCVELQEEFPIPNMRT